MTGETDIELKALLRGKSIDIPGAWSWPENDNKGTQTDKAHKVLRLDPEDSDIVPILFLCQNLLSAYGFKNDDLLSVRGDSVFIPGYSGYIRTQASSGLALNEYLGRPDFENLPFNIVISGSGISELNDKVYEHGPFFNGKPTFGEVNVVNGLWVPSDNPGCFWQTEDENGSPVNPRWLIHSGNNASSPGFFSEENVATPDLVETWSVLSGGNPTPVIFPINTVQGEKEPKYKTNHSIFANGTIYRGIGYYAKDWIIEGWIRSSSSDPVPIQVGDNITGSIPAIGPDEPVEWRKFSIEMSTASGLAELPGVVSLGWNNDIGFSAIPADWAGVSVRSGTFKAAEWRFNNVFGGSLDGVSLPDQLGLFKGTFTNCSCGFDTALWKNAPDLSFGFENYIESAVEILKSDSQVVDKMLKSGVLAQFNQSRSNKEKLAIILFSLL